MSFHQLTPFFRSTNVSKHLRHPDHFTSQVPVKSDSLISTPLILSTSPSVFCKSFLTKNNCRSHLLPSIHLYTVSSVSFREGKYHEGQICWLSKFRIEAKSCDLIDRSFHSGYCRLSGFSFLVLSQLFSWLLFRCSNFSFYLLCWCRIWSFSLLCLECTYTSLAIIVSNKGALLGILPDVL